jgi:hypothetical protein
LNVKDMRGGHETGNALAVLLRPALGEHVGGDEEAEEEEQGDGEENLGRDAGRAMVVHVRAGRAANGAAALDHGARAVGADQVLAAHLKVLPAAGSLRTWRDLEP